MFRTRQQAIIRLIANLAITWILCVGIINFNRNPPIPQVLAWIVSVLCLLIACAGIFVEIREDIEILGRK